VTVTAASLRAEITAFLVFKRALGSPYQRGEKLLRAFERFVTEHARRRSDCSIEDLVRAWLGRNDSRKPVSIANECGVIRQFCLFRRRRDRTAFVPSRAWTPQSTESEFLPNVLTEADIKRLLRLAADLKRPPFRAQLFRMLLLLLYCTGIRFGEALRLRMRDVDMGNAVLFIATSKGRARWVPFHRSLVREIKLYLVGRRRFARSLPDDRFLVGLSGKHLPVGTASATVRGLLRRAALKPPTGRVGPRPYDLRHTFAVHRLERWYRAGVDAQRRLPWLSAYMGHDDILGTETYLTASSELLNVAATRMKRRLRQRRRWP
jgi:integrase/recombinase XerD